MTGSRWQAWLQGLALAPGLVPLGVVFGALAAEQGLSSVQAVLVSAFVLAGVAQFAALGLWSDGAGLAAVVAAVLVINARYVLLSAAAVELGRERGASLRQRIALALLSVEETYAMQNRWLERHAATAGRLIVVGLGVALVWIVATLAGTVVGRRVPDLEPFGLDYMLAGLFLGLLGIFAPTARHAAVGLACVAAGAVLALAGWGVWATLAVPPVAAYTAGRLLRG